MSDIPLTQIDEFRWKIEPTGGMRVPGIIYSSRALMKTADEGVRQVANVAHLPGIVKASLAMPDMHWGYGSPSEAWRPSTSMRGSCPPGVSATTSTADAAWWPRACPSRRSGSP